MFFWGFLAFPLKVFSFFSHGYLIMKNPVELWKWAPLEWFFGHSMTLGCLKALEKPKPKPSYEILCSYWFGRKKNLGVRQNNKFLPRVITKVSESVSNAWWASRYSFCLCFAKASTSSNSWIFFSNSTRSWKWKLQKKTKPVTEASSTCLLYVAKRTESSLKNLSNFRSPIRSRVRIFSKNFWLTGFSFWCKHVVR